jgi:hypothetical protein
VETVEDLRGAARRARECAVIQNEVNRWLAALGREPA